MMLRLTGDELPTVKTLEARAGDRYLLCTHGLFDPVRHEAILEALKLPTSLNAPTASSNGRYAAEDPTMSRWWWPTWFRYDAT